MTTYRFHAAQADGHIVRGVVEAASEPDAGARLAERGLFPLRLAETVQTSRRAASRRDLAIVFRSIAALVAAGVPLERALAASDPVARGPLKGAIADARRELLTGRTMSQGLAAAHGVVPAVVVGMVRAGERGGRLAPALDEAALHLEQEAELVAQVRQALAYPLVLAVAGSASVLVISTVVVPRFAAILADLGETLPPATRMLLATSALITGHWVVLLAAALAFGVLITAWASQPAGQRRLHGILLDLPLIGPLRHALATARLARALAGMLHAGMPLLPALDSAREAAGDAEVWARVGRTRERVAGGQPLAQSLERDRVMTPMALQLLLVGESSGRLAEMSSRAGELAAREAARGLKTLVTLLEPAMVLFFGGLVAFVAAALLQAMYSIRPGGGP